MTQRNPEHWLNGIIGPDTIKVDGSSITTKRKHINLVGATQEDDPDNDATNVTVPPAPAGESGQVQVNEDGATRGYDIVGTGSVTVNVDPLLKTIIVAGGGGGATPGGSDGQAQYKDGSSFAGSPYVTFDEEGYATIEEPTIEAPVVTGGMTIVDASGSWQYLLSPATLAGDRVVFLPVLTGNDTIVMASVSQTLANKTLTAPTFGVASSTAFRVRNPTGTFNYLFQPAAIAADRIVTIPLLTNDDTLVLANFAQTLLNKTLDAPTLAGLVTQTGSATHATNNAKAVAVDLNPVNVQTTDATQTTLDTFTSLADSAVSVSWMVTAIKSDRTQAASYVVSAAFRNNGGTITQVGTTQVSGLEDDANWAVAVDSSGNQIRLRVTGVAATTIQWVAIRTSLVVFP